MVEPGLFQRHHEIDVGPRRGLQPREHQEVSPVPAIEHRGIVVVPQDRHRPRSGRHPAHRGQEQTGQLGVAQHVGAHGQPVLVVEQSQGSLLAGPEEMRLVGHPAQPDHEVGPTVADAGHDVDQARPAGPEHLLPLNDDVALRRDPAQSEPRLGQRAQGQVAFGGHSGGRSSSARSNHKKPYGGNVTA